MKYGAAFRAGIGQQEFKSGHMRSILTGRVRESPKGLGIEKYLRLIPATHMDEVDGTLEV
jgi:hypothetical protein